MAIVPLPSLPASGACLSSEAVSALARGRRLYVVANRGPVHFHLREGRLEPRPAAGGLVTALSSVADRVPLTWIAAAMGAGDRAAEGSRRTSKAAPGSPRVRYVVAPEEALNWFYRRFANPILWFLQHGMWHLLRRPDLTRMVEGGWMLGYRPVNEAFAKVVLQEVSRAERPAVLVQDYHLYLLPDTLRRRVPEMLLQHFTHIPWPGPEAWEPLHPFIRRELCRGLLGADVAGFQTESSVLNFLHCCERFVPHSRVDYVRGTVQVGARRTAVRAYPISIDPQELRRIAGSPEASRYRQQIRSRLCRKTIVRVDRLDPSKNVALGFRAFGSLLERRPDLAGQVRFLAFLVPSRQSIAEYRRYAQEVWREVEAVNSRFGRDGWQPIEVFHEDNRVQAVAGMALADVLLVNSMADGMNLVAKEAPMVSEKDEVLVLSERCGAHRQLGHASLTVKPTDLDGTASALERALEMGQQERRHRGRMLRRAIEAEDLSWWVGRQLEDLMESAR